MAIYRFHGLEAGDWFSFLDRALDLWLVPDLAQTVLGEDEFAALDLDAETRQQSRAVLVELQEFSANDRNPGLS